MIQLNRKLIKEFDFKSSQLFPIQFTYLHFMLLEGQYMDTYAKAEVLAESDDIKDKPYCTFEIISYLSHLSSAFNLELKPEYTVQIEQMLKNDMISIKQKARCIYNKGVIKLVEKNYKEAFDFFYEAYSLYPRYNYYENMFFMNYINSVKFQKSIAFDLDYTDFLVDFKEMIDYFKYYEMKAANASYEELEEYILKVIKPNEIVKDPLLIEIFNHELTEIVQHTRNYKALVSWSELYSLPERGDFDSL